MSDAEKIYVNGIDALTGEYMLSLPVEEAAEAVRQDEASSQAKTSWLRRVWRLISTPHYGLPFDMDPADIRQAGWGVVFHEAESQEVKDALKPLVEHRRQQVGDEAKVKVLRYESGESSARWLSRHGVGAGSIDPTKVPFYLLIVGSPANIPFDFCHLLDVEYCVGSLHFESAEEYGQYVTSLIEYETGATVPNAKEVVFFAPRHPADPATELSADHLVRALAEDGPGGETGAGIAGRVGFRSRAFIGEAARKETLVESLRAAGGDPPALLFTASHGLGFPNGHPRQLEAQGALLCQDWPGFGPASPAHYFAAEDVAHDMRLHGLVAFCFACFGAGTPAYDRFSRKRGARPPAIAEAPFFATLPKRLLARRGGGALAFIGHVERAWGYSIITPDAGPQLVPFTNAVAHILSGKPVGFALSDLNARYAALATYLSKLLDDIDNGAAVTDRELLRCWVERNDAEGYIVFGDPAVRLRVDDMH